MADHQNSAYKIDMTNFVRRLQSLYSHWQEHKHELWGSCNSFTVATPPLSDDIRYLKSSAFNFWLLGYLFPDTIMVFSNKQIHFLCSQKKASLLLDHAIKKYAKEAVGVDIVIHVKSIYDDGSHQMDTIISQQTSNGSVFGIIAKEAPEGELLKKWAEKLNSSGLQFCDITNGLADLFAVKDADELINMKKSARITASAMKVFVVPKIESVIDEEREVTHSSLMHDTAMSIFEPSRIKVNLEKDNVDICYPPVFQSGGEFDLSPNASSNDDHLYYDPGSVIICALGARYNCYCSNVARTFLIDPNAKQTKAYQVLLEAHNAAIGALKPGNKACDVYKAAFSVVLKEAPELAGHLTESCGSGIGLELHEPELSLTEKNEKVLKTGMVFNVSIGFQNLQRKSSNKKSQSYAMLLADTVIVTEIGHAVLTSFVSKNVAYLFGDGDGDGEEEENESSPVKYEVNLTKAVHSDAYENVNDLPPPGEEMMIQVDQKHEAILLPIYGSMVPIHLNNLKTICYEPTDQSSNCFTRLIFNVPNTSSNQTDIFLKEASFRSKDLRHIKEVVEQVKSYKKGVISREHERSTRASLITQEKNVCARSNYGQIRLTDIWIQPPFSGHGPRIQGTLDAYDNGFRYSTSSSDERLEVLFDNIKHAYFQAAEKNTIASLYFQLHNDIMVGNKKTKDVEFYVDVMDVVQTFEGGKGCSDELDEIGEEERERERRNENNASFQSFVKQVNYHWGPPTFKGFEQTLYEPGCRGVVKATISLMVSCLGL